MNNMMTIAGRPVGSPSPCFLIAEVAQAHDGSLGNAHAYIDAVAKTGVDAIKFQTHIAAAESTPGEPWRVAFSKQDASRYDYWRRMEFTSEQWAGLAQHCRDVGLIFLSSAFSIEAVELLEKLDMPAWKVGSGEIATSPLIERMAATGRPVLLSSGLADRATLDNAVALVRQRNAPIALFQCTTAYPCPPEKIGLNLLSELRQRYACPVGLSDHSGMIYAGLAATALGAELIEAHVVFSRECFGPDTLASLTIEEFRQLASGVRNIERMLAAPVNKETQAGELAELRRIFGKSVVAARDLPAGAVLNAADLALKKPGGGYSAAELPTLVGRSLLRAVSRDYRLTAEDFAP